MDEEGEASKNKILEKLMKMQIRIIKKEESKDRVEATWKLKGINFKFY